MNENLSLMLLVVLLTLVIHSIETLQFAVSFVGIRMKRLALTGTLFSMVLLVSRTANMGQGVLLGSFADTTISSQGDPTSFEMRIRVLLLAATLGSILGALFLPTFIRYLSKSVEVFDRHGSFPGLIGAFFRRGGIQKTDFSRAIKSVSTPKTEQIKVTSFSPIPWWFYVMDILITAVFTVGVLSTLYAGILEPEHRSATGQMSGVVNGLATILMFMFISPRVAKCVDNAIQNSANLNQVRTMVIILVLCKIAGTLIAQALLLPCTKLLSQITLLLP